MLPAEALDLPAFLREESFRVLQSHSLTPWFAFRESSVDELTGTFRPAHPRMTVTVRPAGVVACSALVREANGGWPPRRSKMASQPESSPSPSR